MNATSSGAAGQLNRSRELDKLLRGQAKIENTLLEVKRTVDGLSACLLTSSDHALKEASTLNHDKLMQPHGSTHSHEEELSPVAIGQVGPQFSVTSALEEDEPYHATSSDGKPTTAIARYDPVLSNGAATLANGAATLAGPTLPATPHAVFHEISANMVRNDYQQVLAIGSNAQMIAQPSNPSSRNLAAPSLRHFAPYLPVHPTSHGRIAFDCAGMLVLMFDSLMVPVVIGWDITYKGFLEYLGWFLALFWTFDMVANFCTGFSVRGKVVMDFRQIIRRYLKGAFLIDVSILTLDYVELITTAVLENESNSSSLRALKFIRFAKITRLVRIVAKLRMGLQTQIDAIWYYRIHVHGLQGYAQYMRLAGMLMKLLCLIAWLSHVGSCLWYFFGRSFTKSGEQTWYSGLPNADDFDHYMLGLYWTLSTMFSGSSYIEPNNTWEAAFAGVCVLIGAIFVTAITSNLAAILIEAQEAQHDVKKKDRALTSFMEQRHTPVLLALEVRKEFLAKAADAPRLTELDLSFLALIGTPLQTALREAEYAECFLKLPIFRILSFWGDGDGHVMQELCAATTSTFNLSQPGQELFSRFASMEYSILLVEGTMRYRLGTAAGANGEMVPLASLESSGESPAGLGAFSDVTTVTPGSWVCELAVLMPWITRGVLQAETRVETLMVSVESFVKLVASSPGMVSFVSSYASAACTVLSSRHGPMNGGLVNGGTTDIDPGFDVDVLISELHWSIRRLISVTLLNALHRLKNSAFLKRKSMVDLENEVLAGKCYLLPGPSLNTIRIVRLAVLRLMNSDGLLCVRIGVWRSGQVSSRLQLPAVKLEGSESPAEGIERLLSEDFPDFAAHVRLNAVETVVEESLSESYALPSTYVRVVQTASLEANMAFREPGERSEQPQSYQSTGSSMMRPTKTPKFLLHTMSTKNFQMSSVQSELRGSPLAIEGPTPAFAVGSPSDGKSVVNVYKWMSPEDFENRDTRKQADSDLAPWLSQLNVPQLQLMSQWTLSASTYTFHNI